MNKQCQVLYIHEQCIEMCKQVDLNLNLTTSYFTIDGKDIFYTFETIQEVKSFLAGYLRAKGLES